MAKIKLKSPNSPQILSGYAPVQRVVKKRFDSCCQEGQNRIEVLGVIVGARTEDW